MAKVNENFLKLRGGYLFSEIARRVNEFKKANPDREVLRLGIGDVTLPLVPAVVEAMEKASAEMGKAETFRGYGPEFGYDFLRETIAENDFKARGIDISADEIFISDGAKSDCGNIGDIFGVDNIVAVGDPVYPVYVDTNVMGGRSGEPTDERKIFENRLSSMHRGKRLHSLPSRHSHRHNLSLLPQQSHRLGGHKRAA